MRINIAERLKPYSHLPGTFCLLPGSNFRLQIYPARLRIDDIQSPIPLLFADLSISIKGPVKNFTILQDLEKGYVTVCGQTESGFMRYKIYPSPSAEKISMVIEKAPEGSLLINNLKTLAGQCLTLTKNRFELGTFEPYAPFATDRLSLGSHKAQDWDLIRQRIALEEILPIWLRLGQLIPLHDFSLLEGTAQLLEKCRSLVNLKANLEIIPALTKLWLAGFEGMLSPRLQDTDYQGFNINDLNPQSTLSPLVLLTEGAALIRSLFVDVEKYLVKILPAVPPDFHCGRLVNVRCGNFATLDMEWSKKTIRRMILDAHVDKEIHFEFSHVKSFRLRKNQRDSGKRIASCEQIKIESHTQYLLDNFMR
jgi:hypothetical protein